MTIPAAWLDASTLVVVNLIMASESDLQLPNVIAIPSMDSVCDPGNLVYMRIVPQENTWVPLTGFVDQAGALVNAIEDNDGTWIAYTYQF